MVAGATRDIEIDLPRCEKGIGSLIRSCTSEALIEGVRVEPFPVWPDDRGYFLEVARTGTGLISEFPSDATQVSAALSYPGTIKAFHYHRRQTDVWVVAGGMLQVALIDLRPGSRTFGGKNTMYIGELRTWQVLIPPGVGHGYKVIGDRPAMLVYVTNRFYDPEDEGRIPYNETGISYDWDYQYK
jgi:dTDP-4-dehydrorhamnose 3,5-epimerase